MLFPIPPLLIKFLISANFEAKKIRQKSPLRMKNCVQKLLLLNAVSYLNKKQLPQIFSSWLISLKNIFFQIMYREILTCSSDTGVLADDSLSLLSNIWVVVLSDVRLCMVSNLASASLFFSLQKFSLVKVSPDDL